jgi:hypothetical protein
VLGLGAGLALLRGYWDKPLHAHAWALTRWAGHSFHSPVSALPKACACHLGASRSPRTSRYTGCGRLIIHSTPKRSLHIPKYGPMDQAYSDFWKTPNNYEGPRVFCVSNRHGWVVPMEFSDPNQLQRLRERNARFFVEPVRSSRDTPLGGWLASHAKIVATTAQGEVWQLL